MIYFAFRHLLLKSPILPPGNTPETMLFSLNLFSETLFPVKMLKKFYMFGKIQWKKIKQELKIFLWILHYFSLKK
ncbi:hypothetical protein EG345_05680 [Chryseobacterium carnipullorum]|nr:hypothetical protein EG345_05680 [Chryseobacterium carnipullorum]